jgi:hypothetical protein
VDEHRIFDRAVPIHKVQTNLEQEISKATKGVIAREIGG